MKQANTSAVAGSRSAVGFCPVQLGADDDVFQVEVERLAALAETARQLNISYCTTDIQPACDRRPYHENFERHRQRLAKVGDVLAGSGTPAGDRF